MQSNRQSAFRNRTATLTRANPPDSREGVDVAEIEVRADRFFADLNARLPARVGVIKKRRRPCYALRKSGGRSNACGGLFGAQVECHRSRRSESTYGPRMMRRLHLGARKPFERPRYGKRERAPLRSFRAVAVTQPSKSARGSRRLRRSRMYVVGIEKYGCAERHLLDLAPCLCRTRSPDRSPRRPQGSEAFAQNIPSARRAAYGLCVARGRGR